MSVFVYESKMSKERAQRAHREEMAEWGICGSADLARRCMICGA